jgi:hypothetical protein
MPRLLVSSTEYITSCLVLAACGNDGLATSKAVTSVCRNWPCVKLELYQSHTRIWLWDISRRGIVGSERESAKYDIDNIVGIYQLLEDVGTCVTSGAGQDDGGLDHGWVS